MLMGVIIEGLNLGRDSRKFDAVPSEIRSEMMYDPGVDKDDPSPGRNQKVIGRMCDRKRIGLTRAGG